MSAFLTGLLSASLSSSLAIALLITINKLTANRVPASFRYFMWLIVLIGLLIPFRPNLAPPSVRMHIRLPIGAAENAVSRSLADETIYAMIAETGPLERGPHVPTASGEPLQYLAHVLFWTWMAGASVILGFHLFSYGNFVSAVRRWGKTVEDGRILSALREAKGASGLHGKPIGVKTCVLVSSPMLIGFFRPVILLPEGEIATGELDHVFRHELTHYKHRDLWVNLLVLAVHAVHWFNPLVHLMARAVRMDCEAACDEAVMSGCDAKTRKHYGETILAFIGGHRPGFPILSTYFFESGSSMKKRLFAIMNTAQKSKGLAALCAAGLIVANLFFGSALKASSEPTYHEIAPKRAMDAAMGPAPSGKAELPEDKNGSFRSAVSNGSIWDFSAPLVQVGKAQIAAFERARHRP